MYFVAFFYANTTENQLAIFFNSLIIEYTVSILRYQHDVVGNLTAAHSNETFKFVRIYSEESLKIIEV
jgi:hypothetical protein